MNRYKIAFIFPKDAALGLGHFYRDAFESEHYETEVFEYDFGPWKYLGHFNVWPDFMMQKIRFDFDKIRTFAPDFIIVMKGNYLDEAFLAKVKTETGAHLWNIYPDNPFTSLKENVYHFSAAIKQYDLIWASSPQFIPLFYQLGANKVKSIPFGYDPKVHYPVGHEDDAYRSDIAYLGTWGQLQETWLNGLAPFYNLKIFGGGWKHCKNNKLLYHCWQKGLGLGKQMKNAVSGSKLVFNLIRAEHGAVHSMKTFELIACGGCVITNRTPEQEEFFTDGKDILFFDTETELREKIDYYLSHEDERQKIVQTALETVQKYTYNQRVKILIDAMEQ